MKGQILANRSSKKRSLVDFYATPQEVTKALITFLDIPKDKIIWECACGKGNMSKVIEEAGYRVISTDLYERGYGEKVDFLTIPKGKINCNWIITNPPFSKSVEFIKKSYDLGVEGFAFLLKSQYWHSKKRLSLFEKTAPAYILPLTWRPDFLFGEKSGSPTMEVLWTVWTKRNQQVARYIPLEKPIREVK